MKILAPVDRPEEASRLAALGAREFYGGFLSSVWEERYTLAASANRRSFPEAQIAGSGALRETVAAAHEKNAPFFLTVNSPFYVAEQFGPLLETIEEALAAGIDAIIAADTGLLVEARRRWPELPVHLSTMAEVTNSAAAAFYGRLGVRRITLPRHLGLEDVRGIVAGSPGMKFDVFVLYGQCVNAEGLCTFSHDHPQRVWPCVQPYRISCEGEGEERGSLAPAVCAQMLWDGLERGEACGLCSLPDLAETGIESLKIVGRGTSTERKEWAVSAVSGLLEYLEREKPGREEFCHEARRRYGERFPRGCRPTLCYFPELAEAAVE